MFVLLYDVFETDCIIKQWPLDGGKELRDGDNLIWPFRLLFYFKQWTIIGIISPLNKYIFDALIYKYNDPVFWKYSVFSLFFFYLCERNLCCLLWPSEIFVFMTKRPSNIKTPFCLQLIRQRTQCSIEPFANWNVCSIFHRGHTLKRKWINIQLLKRALSPPFSYGGTK